MPLNILILYSSIITTSLYTHVLVDYVPKMLKNYYGCRYRTLGKVFVLHTSDLDSILEMHVTYIITGTEETLEHHSV